MNSRETGRAIENLDAEKNPQDYLEHYIRKNMQPGKSSLSLASLENDNFDHKFVQSLFEKPTTQTKEDKTPDPTAEEIKAYQKNYEKEHHKDISDKEASLRISFERISAKTQLKEREFRTESPILPGQKTLSRIYYHVDKNGQEKDPTFSLAILKNIQSATEQMVKAAIEEDWTVSLNLTAEHFTHVRDKSRIGGRPMWVGDTYRAKGDIIISL